MHMWAALDRHRHPPAQDLIAAGELALSRGAWDRGRDSFEAALASLAALDPMRTIANIRCPTLLVHSEMDPVPVEWAQTLADTIPGADYACSMAPATLPTSRTPTNWPTPPCHG